MIIIFAKTVHIKTLFLYLLDTIITHFILLVYSNLPYAFATKWKKFLITAISFSRYTLFILGKRPHLGSGPGYQGSVAMMTVTLDVQITSLTPIAQLGAAGYGFLNWGLCSKCLLRYFLVPIISKMRYDDAVLNFYPQTKVCKL